MTNEEKVMDALYRSYQLLGSKEYAIFSYYRSLAEQMRKDDVKVGEIMIGEKEVENVIIKSSKDNPLPTNREEAFKLIPQGGIVCHNADQNQDVRVSRNTIKHSSLHNNQDSFAIFAKIDQVVAKAVKIGDIPIAEDEIGKTNSVGIYYVPVNVNGTQYSARLVIKELVNRGRVLDELSLYNVSMHKEKGSQRKQLNAPTELGSDITNLKTAYKVKDLIHNSQTVDKEILGIDAETLFNKTYHGSGASFDKFDHSFMGTGEGAQAFGWGTYVTEVEGIGKHYAESTSGNIFKGGFGDFYLKKIREGLAEGKGFEEIKKNLLDYHAYLYQKTGGNRELYGDFISDYEKLQSLKEEDLPKRNLYTVEIPDDNGSNYLRWKTDNNQETIDKLNEAYRNMLLERGVEEEDISPDFAPFSTGVSGESIYKIFARELGSDKNASEFLNRQGFVGISYPAEAMTGGRADNARNYVIFNENDAQIEEHIRFSKGPKLSKKEREILRKEVMKNNNLYGKNKPIESAFTANNFYIYNNFGNDDFSVIRRIKIEGNEDLINDLYNEVQNGTNEDTKNISRTIKEVIRRRRVYNSNNSNAKGERRNDGGYVDLDLRESSERGADNAEGNRNERQTTLGRGYVKTNLDGTNGPRYVPIDEGETPLFSRNTTDDIIKELISKGEITFTDEQGNPCAACGMGGVKGTKWEIVKDFNGMPKHSQGGVDIMLTDNGVRIIRDGGEIECKNGLFINSYEE